ncbi:MAG: tripartite tricarboxylate transporter substrate binding protein [Ramlibacter sp.]
MFIRSVLSARRAALKAGLLALAAGLSILPGLAAAAYPEKPIRLIVPYPPGGATDVIGRVMAQKLSGVLGQTVIVDNRGGAGGNIGADAVAKAAPDGYTLLMGAVTSHSIMSTLEKATIHYNFEKDLVPISIVGSVPLVFVVHPSVPAKTLKELIAHAKSKPGELSFASSGAGAPQRLAAEMFKRQAGVEMIHVPYKGSGPAMTDLMGGQVLTMVETVPAALPHIRAGKIRPLAVTTAQRISMLPDVPTATEAGLPGFEVSSLFGILAPAGTPKEIITRLNSEITKLLSLPEVKEQLLAQGAFSVTTTPEQAAARVHQEVEMWAKVIKEANVKPD